MLLPLLAVGVTPLLKIKRISQAIDSKTVEIVNATTLSSPFATSSFGASASFEVQSSKFKVHPGYRSRSRKEFFSLQRYPPPWICQKKLTSSGRRLLETCTAYNETPYKRLLQTSLIPSLASHLSKSHCLEIERHPGF